MGPNIHCIFGPSPTETYDEIQIQCKAYSGHELPEHSNFQITPTSERLALPNHSYFKGVSYMAFRQIKPPHEATRTATHSCRDPETRMSFLVASWHPPQSMNQNSWCRILSLICVKSFITIGWETTGPFENLITATRRRTFTGLKNVNFRRHHSHLIPPIQQIPANIGITLISSQTGVSRATLPPLIVWVYLHSNFSDGLWKANA